MILTLLFCFACESKKDGAKPVTRTTDVPVVPLSLLSEKIPLPEYALLFNNFVEQLRAFGQFNLACQHAASAENASALLLFMINKNN
ncbi:MAG: hypothetical protein LBS61_05800 [Endomicrobium sp.]|jgi:hypothetical protein|nr:hypothetical protein [Endomicrobium sp.]